MELQMAYLSLFLPFSSFFLVFLRFPFFALPFPFISLFFLVSLALCYTFLFSFVGALAGTPRTAYYDGTLRNHDFEQHKL